MYKTIWKIEDKTNACITQLTYYHLGKTPKFPTWYMEENHVYEIEIMFNIKLIKKISIFIQCLTHCSIIK